MTAGIKEAVSVPVMLTGGIVTPEAAEKLLKDKKANLIGVGRALLKDSLWAKKAMGDQGFMKITGNPGDSEKT